MDVNTHLNFAGNCREAFDYYAKTLGGTIDFAMTWGESPTAADCGPEQRDKIMHMSMRVGGTLLMGADSPPDRFEKAAGMMLSVSPKTADEAKTLFDALAEGGSITMPLEATFWSPAFGMLVDRFGIPWMVSTEGPAA